MKTLLVIEDDTKSQKVYIDKFTEEGFEVGVSNTGSGGLTLVKKINPDVILLDVMLAGKTNGFDVLESLKNNPLTKNIPVMVLTNLDSEEKVAKEIGAAEYLIKANTSIEEIVEKTKKLIEGKANL
jgi:DNA-binding response OmpR family regulator